MIGFVSNDRVFLQALVRERPRRRVHRGVVRNTAPYAVYLDAAEGYRVVNEEAAAARTDAAVAAALAKEDVDLDRDVPEAIEAGLGEAVALFQSEVGATAEPLTAGGPRRPRHAAGLNWADRSTELASSYVTEVNDRPAKAHPYSNVEFAPRRRGGVEA